MSWLRQLLRYVHGKLYELPYRGYRIQSARKRHDTCHPQNRIQLFKDAARQIVENAFRYYEDGDDSVLPRSFATRDAFLNAMALDIAMGGSTNTVLHLLAVAQEGGVDFTMKDIDALSARCLVCASSRQTHRNTACRSATVLEVSSE